MRLLRPLTLDESLSIIYNAERLKLNLQGLEITFHVWEEGAGIGDNATPTPGVHKRKDRSSYAFILTDDILRNPKQFRSTCKHELYHIAKGHYEKMYPTSEELSKSILSQMFSPKNLLRCELPAVLYQYLSIKTI